jgi:hypothetical protein
MNPSEIGKKLSNLVKQDSHDFSPHYSNYEKEFTSMPLLTLQIKFQ